MSIGDMLQAQRDAEDAARYRWLRDQFQLHVEARQWEELVKDSGKERVYEKREEYWCQWELRDDWRFGETVKFRDAVRSLEAVIDDLRAASSASGAKC